MYSAAESKRKADGSVQRVKQGHGEEPEFLAVIGVKKNSPPTQPAFTANERAQLIHCSATEEFRPFVKVLLKGTQLRVE